MKKKSERALGCGLKMMHLDADSVLRVSEIAVFAQPCLVVARQTKEILALSNYQSSTFVPKECANWSSEARSQPVM